MKADEWAEKALDLLTLDHAESVRAVTLVIRAIQREAMGEVEKITMTVGDAEAWGTPEDTFERGRANGADEVGRRIRALIEANNP